MDNVRRIAVAGATGRQGGAVARILAARGWSIRALTRRPDSAEAYALAELGIEPVACDLGDRAAIESALAGIDGLFLTTTPYEGGVDVEERLAGLALDAARRAGVRQLVYSSVAWADRPTGVAHFESKGRIERMIDAAPFPFTTILRPAFFMEMLLSPRFSRGVLAGSVDMMLSPETPIAMVSIHDIAAFARLAFERPDALDGRRIELAGDQPTAAGMVEALARVLERPIAYRRIAAADVAGDGMPRLVTQRWLEDAGWRIDVDALAAAWPVELTDIAAWADRHRAALLAPV